MLLLPYFDLLSQTLLHPLPPIIYLPSLPLSISPSLTSCFPACQTVIINGENDSPPGPREPSTLTALGEIECICASECVCVCMCFPLYLQTFGLWSALSSMRLYVQCQQRSMISPPPKNTPNDLQRLPNTGRKHRPTCYPRAITHTHYTVEGVHWQPLLL